MKNTILRTQLEVALVRSAAAAKQVERQSKAAEREAKRAAFATRLNADAYTCRREGDTWIAEGAGQVFEYTKTDEGDVLVMSHTGGIYLISVDDSEEAAGEFRCDCPSAARTAGFGCKHLVGWEAVRAHHRAQRASVKSELQAEAAEMHAEDDDHDPTPAPSGAALPRLIEVVEAVALEMECPDEDTDLWELAQRLRDAVGNIFPTRQMSNQPSTVELREAA